MVVAAEVDQLGELLRDRAGDLREGEVAHVVGDRPQDPDDIDSVVAVEALVLDGHDRVLHRRGDVGRPFDAKLPYVDILINIDGTVIQNTEYSTPTANYLVR